jgi:hypothetical protein
LADKGDHHRFGSLLKVACSACIKISIQ